MKPKPLVALNHFTVPTAIVGISFCGKNTQSEKSPTRSPCRSHSAATRAYRPPARIEDSRGLHRPEMGRSGGVDVDLGRLDGHPDVRTLAQTNLAHGCAGHLGHDRRHGIDLDP